MKNEIFLLKSLFYWEYDKFLTEILRFVQKK